ncbi:MAG: glycosyltransferase family 4 protein [Pseudomonadota bacterium]
MNLVPDGAAGRLGRGTAAIQLFTKGAFDQRLIGAGDGRVPRDFFYGFLGLIARGYDARWQQTDGAYAGAGASADHLRERVVSRLTGLSRRHRVLKEMTEDWRQSKAAVSFTDHFSLTLGDYLGRQPKRPFAAGLFHGLSDIQNRLPALGQMTGDRYIRRALAGLDHVGFFGPADRDEAVRRYGLEQEKTSIYPFGIDADFWSPGDGDATPEPNVLSVGSDPSRDFATLAAAPIDAPVRIITRLKVDVPAGRDVEVTSGHYFESPLDDVGLRDLYRKATVVVVTLKDVFQPTGYSVCLQAMACGRPVVLSDIKGLWAPGLYKDGEHCLLVPPGDPRAMAASVNRLLGDTGLRERLGKAARQVTLDHFPLSRMDDGLEALVLRAPGMERPCRG